MDKVVKKAILCLGDMHAPDADMEAIRQARAYYDYLTQISKEVVVVQMGDIMDQKAWSRFPSDPDDDSPQLEWDRTEKQLREIAEIFPNLHVLTGNHCLSEDTEVWSDGKWVHYTELKKGSKVLTLNSEGMAEEQEVNEVFTRSYEGEMFSYADMLVTPEHRVYHRVQQSGKIGYATPLELLEKKTRRVQVVASAYLPTELEYNISDNDIRLAGWMLTDSCIGRSYAEDMQKLLELIENDKNSLPSWVFNLSTRQFGLLLETLLLTDGTKGNTLYCNRESIYNPLQALCAKHGYTMKTVDYKTHTGIHKRHYISKNSFAKGADGKINDFSKMVEYKGVVWCLNVDNTNFLVRRNGVSFFTGNCLRVYKKINEAMVPKQFIKRFDQLIDVPGWKWHFDPKPLTIDDILFIHGDELAGDVAAKARRLGKSVVQGHTHQGHVHHIRTFQHEIFAMDVGCMMDPMGKGARYAARNPNTCFIGFGVILDGVPHLIPKKHKGKSKP